MLVTLALHSVMHYVWITFRLYVCLPACFLACRFCFIFLFVRFYMCGMWPYWLAVWLWCNSVLFFFKPFPTRSLSLCLTLFRYGNEYMQFFLPVFDFGTLHWCHYNVCMWIGFFLIISCLHICQIDVKTNERQYDCSRCIQFFRISINKTYKIKVYVKTKRRFDSVNFNILTIITATKIQIFLIFCTGKRVFQIIENILRSKSCSILCAAYMFDFAHKYFLDITVRLVYWTINIKTDNAPNPTAGDPLNTNTFFQDTSNTIVNGTWKMNNKKWNSILNMWYVAQMCLCLRHRSKLILHEYENGKL